MTLYILGNGFDLAHGLKTRYSDFKSYLETSDNQGLSDNQRLFKTLNDIYSEKELWSDFENALGNPDVGKVEKINKIFNMDVFALLPNEIAKAIKKWISASFTIFSNDKKVFDFSENDKFISFNYTEVLEFIYDIKDENILHIHGCVPGFYNSNEELIIGHGKKIDSDSLDLIKKTKKDTATILQSHKEQIDAYINAAKEIHVYGFSYSEIDYPYFDYIARTARDVKWLFYYHSENDIHNIKKYVSKMKFQNRGLKYNLRHSNQMPKYPQT